MVSFEQGPTSVNVVAHGVSGVATWSAALDPGSFPDLPGGYALDLNGDGNDDLLLQLVQGEIQRLP